jgi:hypothetical protein
MSIALVVTGGFGNGTLSGSVSDIVTRGYTIGTVVAIASDLIITVRLEDFAGEFIQNPTVEAADFTLTIRNATGTLVSFGQLDILPVVEPANSYILKMVMSDVEKAAALLAASPILTIDIKDATDPPVFQHAAATWTGDTDNIDAGKILDIIEGDHTETYAKIIIMKKGTETEVLNKNVGGSLLPANITITTSEP